MGLHFVELLPFGSLHVIQLEEVLSCSSACVCVYWADGWVVSWASRMVDKLEQIVVNSDFLILS